MAGAGDDFLIGGSGNDTATHHDEFSGVLVDLSIVGVQNTVGGGNDLLQSIENSSRIDPRRPADR